MANREKTALVVIDMQNGFLNSLSRHIIPNVVELVRGFERLEIPIVFTRFFNSDDSQFERLIGWKKHYTSPETDFANELEHHAVIEIRKNFYTALTETMKEHISSNRWETVVLCGVATESCVLKTAVDVFEMGLHPIVVSDACASDRGEEMHNAGLSVLRRFIGVKQILSMEELFSMIS